ncbi:hypothetical protein HDU76_011805, partial [Blyttiomyces sp. JEL0837]
LSFPHDEDDEHDSRHDVDDFACSQAIPASAIPTDNLSHGRATTSNGRQQESETEELLSKLEIRRQALWYQGLIKVVKSSTASTGLSHAIECFRQPRIRFQTEFEVAQEGEDFKPALFFSSFPRMIAPEDMSLQEMAFKLNETVLERWDSTSISFQDPYASMLTQIRRLHVSAESLLFALTMIYNRACLSLRSRSSSSDQASRTLPRLIRSLARFLPFMDTIGVASNPPRKAEIVGTVFGLGDAAGRAVIDGLVGTGVEFDEGSLVELDMANCKSVSDLEVAQVLDGYLRGLFDEGVCSVGCVQEPESVKVRGEL